MDMNKILQNLDSAAEGEYTPSKQDSSDMKMILESFYDVAQQDVEKTESQQVDEMASVTMSGDSADEVAQLVKLMNDAGASEAAPVGPQPTPMPTSVDVPADGPPDMPPMVTPKMMDDFESGEEPVEEGDAKVIMHRKAEREDREEFVADAGEMGMTAEEAGEFWDTTNGETESYENEPDERYDDHETMINDLSGGLNQRKDSFKRAEPGDNPMAVEQSLAEELSSMLKKKMSEKKDQDGDGDSDFADVQIARMMASGMSKEEAEKKVKDKDYNEDIDVTEKKGPCWKGYKMVGTKKKNGKEVPNCVPKESASESSKKKENEIAEGAADTKAKMKQIVSAFKPLTKGEKVVKAFSYKPGKEFASIPVIITENPKADEMYGPFASYIWTEKFGEMSHSYYHPDLEDAVDHAKNEIKDDAEQGNLDPSMGQQRLPFEEDDIGEEKKKGVDGKACWDGYRYAGREQKADGTYKDKCVKVNNSEYAEAGPDPVKKNMDKFARPQTQTDRKKEMKRGKGVKHKGKDMQTESSPVFSRYVKPLLDKKPTQIVEFYDRESLNIIDRLTQERRALAEKEMDTQMHEAIIGKLREGLSALSEKTLEEARRRRYGGGYRGGYTAFPRSRSRDINRIGYGDGRGANLGSDKAAFKRREMEVELGDEEPNNYAVYIGEKPWKVFRSQRQAEKAAATIKSKYGKDTKVFQTAAPPSS